jgi:hypothetical protein
MLRCDRLARLAIGPTAAALLHACSGSPARTPSHLACFPVQLVADPLARLASGRIRAALLVTLRETDLAYCTTPHPKRKRE